MTQRGVEWASRKDMVQLFVGAVASQANTVLHCDGQLLSVLFNDAVNS